MSSPTPKASHSAGQDVPARLADDLLPSNAGMPLPLAHFFSRMERKSQTTLGVKYSAAILDTCPGDRNCCQVLLLGHQIDPRQREEIRDICNRLHATRHPNIARMDWLDTLDGTAVVTHRPPDALDVLSFVRRLGKRSMESLLPVLTQAASALDFAEDNGLELHAQPRDVLILADTPDMRLLFFPRLPGEQEEIDSDSEATLAAVCIGQRGKGTSTPLPSVELAALIYWMVAARMPTDSAYRSERAFKAIEGLSEPGNAILCAALCGKFPAPGQDLLAALCRAENLPLGPKDQAPGGPVSTYQSHSTRPNPSTPVCLSSSSAITPQTPQRPGPHLSPGVAAEFIPAVHTLRLHETGSSTPFVELAAGHVYRIGRQKGTADFVAHFLPRGLENDSLTRGLSKEHARLEYRHGDVFLVDAGSTNGTTWNGIQIHRAPCRITKNGEIGLATGVGSCFRLDIVLCPPLVRNPLEISATAGLQGVDPPATSGCALLVPRQQDGLAARHLWLFGQAAIGSQPGLPLVVKDSAIAPVQGILYYHRQSVWIHNLVDNQAVAVDGIVMDANAIAPLADGSTLRLGIHSFSVEAY